MSGEINTAERKKYTSAKVAKAVRTKKSVAPEQKETDLFE
jgi:hypothetical protein